MSEPLSTEQSRQVRDCRYAEMMAEVERMQAIIDTLPKDAMELFNVHLASRVHFCGEKLKESKTEEREP